MLFDAHHKWILRHRSWPSFCYIPLPTLHSNQTMVPSIFQTHHDPYCCCTFAHGVPSASVSPPLFTSIRLLLSFRALTWIPLIPHLLFLSTFSRFQDPNYKMSSFYSITHVFLFLFCQSLLFPSSRSIVLHLPHFLYQVYDYAIYLIFNMFHISFSYKRDNSNNS